MTSFDDPLNEILLPAEDIGKRTMHGERKNASAAEKLLSAAVLVLLAERDSYRWLMRDMRDQREKDQHYINELRAELSPEARERINGLFRLHSRGLGVAGTVAENG